MARDIGIELGVVTGTGPGGRIVKADIQAAEQQGLVGVSAPATPQPAAASAAPSTPAQPAAPVETPAVEPHFADAVPPTQQPVGIPPAPAMAEVPEGGTAKGTSTRQGLSRMQQTVARRMAESKATAPDFQLTVEVDMQKIVKLSDKLRKDAGDQPIPSFNDFVIKAAALALRDFPRVNGSYRDGEFELYSRVNVGIAVAGEDTLLVPTIFDADRKTLGAISQDARALAKRARAGALTPPELSGGTFSISNLGMYGIKRFNAVVNPPQAAILAVGAIEPRTVVRNGKVKIRSMMDLTISCDHRILNGADGAEFLVRVRERLEQPLTLLL
ncbi:MAG: 2-oxo acid dehydrogenase subunit E2 [Actinomycetota bacterium]|nr:2-oxo acid dehydrogenase subunit E2 [Actinomycetota bacterium]